MAKEKSISLIFYFLLLLQFATLLLCCYGFLKEIRPSEPFLTDYLLGNSSGITQVCLCFFLFFRVCSPAVRVVVVFITDHLLGNSTGITQVEHRGLVLLQIWAKNLRVYHVHHEYAHISSGTTSLPTRTSLPRTSSTTRSTLCGPTPTSASLSLSSSSQILPGALGRTKKIKKKALFPGTRL